MPPLLWIAALGLGLAAYAYFKPGTPDVDNSAEGSKESQQPTYNDQINRHSLERERRVAALYKQNEWCREQNERHRQEDELERRAEAARLERAQRQAFNTRQCNTKEKAGTVAKDRDARERSKVSWQSLRVLQPSNTPTNSLYSELWPTVADASVAKPQYKNEHKPFVTSVVDEALAAISDAEEDAFNNVTNYTYQQLRSAADTMRKKSHGAHSLGKKNRQLISNYLHIAERYTVLCELYNKRAAMAAFKQYNPKYDPDLQNGLKLCDLHGLYVAEAESHVVAHIQHCQKLGMKRTKLITGKGNRSRDGIPKLKKAIKQILETKDKWNFQENEGDFVVTFC